MRNAQASGQIAQLPAQTVFREKLHRTIHNHFLSCGSRQAPSRGLELV
jgi:hypothetical protein